MDVLHALAMLSLNHILISGVAIIIQLPPYLFRYHSTLLGHAFVCKYIQILSIEANSI